MNGGGGFTHSNLHFKYVVVNKETVLTFEQLALCGGGFWWWWYTYVNVTVVVVAMGWVYPLQCGVYPSTHWCRYRTATCTQATCTVCWCFLVDVVDVC